MMGKVGIYFKNILQNMHSIHTNYFYRKHDQSTYFFCNLWLKRMENMREVKLNREQVGYSHLPPFTMGKIKTSHS